jgi:5-formyltetrahydrofolate cyclo-ligase
VSLVCGGCGGEFTRKVRLAKLYKSHACSLNCAKILNVRKALDRKKTAIKKEWKNSNHKLRLQKWIERHEFSQWFKKCKGQRLGGKEEGSGWKVKCASATKTLQGRSITNRLNLSDEIKPLSWRQHATKRLGWVSLKVKRQKNQWSLRCYNTRKMMKDRAFKKS